MSGIKNRRIFNVLLLSLLGPQRLVREDQIQDPWEPDKLPKLLFQFAVELSIYNYILHGHGQKSLFEFTLSL